MWVSTSPEKGFTLCVCLGEGVTPSFRVLSLRGVSHVSGQDPVDPGGPFVGVSGGAAPYDPPPGAPPSSSPPRSPKPKAARII